MLLFRRQRNNAGKITSFPPPIIAILMYFYPEWQYLLLQPPQSLNLLHGDTKVFTNDKLIMELNFSICVHLDYFDLNAGPQYGRHKASSHYAIQVFWKLNFACGGQKTQGVVPLSSIPVCFTSKEGQFCKGTGTKCHGISMEVSCLTTLNSF